MNRACALIFLALGLIFPLESFGTSQDWPNSPAYLPQLIQAEQRLNDKVQNTREFHSITDTTLPAEYRPENQHTFSLISYLIPASELVILSTADRLPDQRLLAPDGRVRFFVHPITLPRLAPQAAQWEIEDKFLATALSSYRSLITWEPHAPAKFPALAVKVSLDSKIGASTRMLWRPQIERAVFVSRILRDSNQKKMQAIGLHMIDEPYHVYLKQGDWGYSLRDLPDVGQEAQLLPMFSLYAKRDRPQSLLQEMIERSGREPRDFVRQELIKPMVRHFMYLLFEEGLVGGHHEQNVLVELKNGKLTGRFFYRDLGGYFVNESIRTAAGKAITPYLTNLNRQDLRADKAGDPVSYLIDYLVHSNFYAMRAALRPELHLKSEWVEQEVLKAASDWTAFYTGHQVKSWSALRGAITKWSKASRCQKLWVHR